MNGVVFEMDGLAYRAMMMLFVHDACLLDCSGLHRYPWTGNGMKLDFSRPLAVIRFVKGEISMYSSVSIGKNLRMLSLGRCLFLQISFLRSPMVALLL